MKTCIHSALHGKDWTSLEYTNSAAPRASPLRIRTSPDRPEPRSPSASRRVKTTGPSEQGPPLHPGEGNLPMFTIHQKRISGAERAAKILRPFAFITSGWSEWWNDSITTTRQCSRYQGNDHPPPARPRIPDHSQYLQSSNDLLYFFIYYYLKQFYLQLTESIWIVLLKAKWTGELDTSVYKTVFRRVLFAHFCACAESSPGLFISRMTRRHCLNNNFPLFPLNWGKDLPLPFARHRVPPPKPQVVPTKREHSCKVARPYPHPAFFR